MTDKHYIQMNKDEFNTNYTIIKNPFSDYGDGISFSLEGEELEYVRCNNPACVWTKVIGYDGGIWLLSGYHYEDRIGFLLTEEPFPVDTLIEVKWEERKRRR